MGGGLIQLVAYGSQDSYLIGNPQITFFKVVYRRHTNYAKESVQQFFSTEPDFGKIVNANISNNGDLVQDMYLEIILPTSNVSGGYYWIYGIGNALVKKAELEIGGKLIDRHYSEWLDIWTELTIPTGKKYGYDQMVGNYPMNFSGGSNQALYVPLQFWFNRNPGLALPLVAMKYHEIRIHLEIKDINYLLSNGISYSNTDYTGELSLKLYCDFIYLDHDERLLFSSKPQEYLIEQVQFNGDTFVSSNLAIKKTDINFTNPIKEIIWVHISENAIGPTKYNRFFDYSLYSDGMSNSFKSARIQFNGLDRFLERESDYFLKVQNFQAHTNIPRFSSQPYRQYINTYSFALNADLHQPSGFCNFSSINDATLLLTYPRNSIDIRPNLTLKIFAVSLNILRIVNGMAGLLYSNN